MGKRHLRAERELNPEWVLAGQAAEIVMPGGDENLQAALHTLMSEACFMTDEQRAVVEVLGATMAMRAVARTNGDING